MEKKEFNIAIAEPEEYKEIGQLMASVYAALDGFPSKDEQPGYYALFDNLQSIANNEHTDLLTARTVDGELLGSVIYFGDMQYYGSGGTATSLKNASGLRLLAVQPTARGNGVGRVLTDRCVDMARDKKQNQVILHTTSYMQAAWALYEKMGFKRFEEIDFMQEELPVFGFNLSLKPSNT